MSALLIDAGPLVALFNRKDIAHMHYTDVVQNNYKPLRLQTTWPCIVEACHFLKAPERMEMLQWIGDGAVQVFPFDTHHILDMLPWMLQYTDSRVEMDFADASLYWLAHESGVKHIMTMDVRDFSRYRLPNGGAFELV